MVNVDGFIILCAAFFAGLLDMPIPGLGFSPMGLIILGIIFSVLASVYVPTKTGGGK